MRLFINAGGKGERLYPLTKDIPKPMVTIEGKPVLEHLINWAKKYGVDSIVIMSGYKSEVIKNYFGDGSQFGIPIYHSIESEPLGSGGALKYAREFINDTFIYISGDHICDVNLTNMLAFHKEKNSHLTALVHESTHPEDSDILNINGDSQVTRFISKRDDHTGAGNLSNSGLCIIEPQVVNLMDSENFELEGYLYPRILFSGLNMYAYKTDEFIADMGTPERLEKCKNYLSQSQRIKTIILYGGSTNETYVGKGPLPMTLIAGKAFLEHQINFLKKNGLNDIVLCGNDENKIIQSHFGEGVRFGVNITYSQEDFSLGTGGAIKSAEKYINEPFIVLNGDSLSDTNLKHFYEFHKSKTAALGSLILTDVDDTKGYGLVRMADKKIEDFVADGPGGLGTISTGIYIFNPEIFNLIPAGRKVSLEKEILPQIAKDGRLFGSKQEGFFITVDRPETYHQFKKHILKQIEINGIKKVRDAMQLIDENQIDLLLIVDSEHKLKGVINDNIIRKFIVAGGDSNASVLDAMVKEPSLIGRTNQTEEEIEKLLNRGTRHLPIIDDEGRVADLHFPKAEMEIKSYPVVRGKSPLRISFAGGGTDMPYYFEENGGVVISTTIDKYCHLTAAKRADSKLVITSDLDEGEAIFDIRDLVYDGRFDIIKAVFNILKPKFGIDLYLHNDLPPGRGLGSSASFAALMTKAIGELDGKPYDDETVAEIAYRAEVDELSIVGGKQDQYAAVFGGFNWIEFSSGDKKTMHPLRLREDTVDELMSHITLCYTGLSHKSESQQINQKKTFQENQEDISKRLEKLKKIADEIKESLLSVKPNFKTIGELLHESWQYKRNLSSSVSNNSIDRLYEAGIEAGAYGGKVLGSGGGGYILFLHPPKIRNPLRRVLEKEGGQTLSFNFESRGIRIWNADKYQ